jgi:hypothetical protein
VTAVVDVVGPAATRSPLRSVALPAEHGGWGLTVEPGILGLLIAPSAAGWCIALGAVVAFLARTPMKVVAVDRRRGRQLERTRLAQRVAAAELAILALLAAGAVRLAEPWFWVPGLVALPLLAVESWFEVRSRGRRLLPELAGAIGVCSVAAMVVLAAGEGGRLAAGLWLLLAARVATSIPHVRAQIARLHQRPSQARAVAAGDLAAGALAAAAVALAGGVAAGALAVVAVIALQRLAGGRPVPRPVVLGLRQMVMGLGVVAVTAIGVLASAS